MPDLGLLVMRVSGLVESADTERADDLDAVLRKEKCVSGQEGGSLHKICIEPLAVTLLNMYTRI